MKRTSIVAILTAFLATAHAQEDQNAISAELIFDGGSDRSEQLMHDFQETLFDRDGQVIWLNLKLTNTVDPTANNTYSLTRLTDTKQSDDEATAIICGASGQIGLIDNLEVEYLLSFHRPSDFHGPTTIHLGDRRRYPLHSLKCGMENYTEAAETPLHIRGYFVVEVSEIPTANQYVLLPIDR